MMQDQTRPAPSTDELPWQYIGLIVAIAVIAVLASLSPIEVERAPRPVSLSELAFTERYDDPSGVSLSYPAGWEVSALQPGQFVVANYSNAGMVEPAQPNQIAILVRTFQLDQIGYESGTDVNIIMLDIVGQIGMTEDDIVNRTIDGSPASVVQFSENGVDFTVVLSTPNENALVQIVSNATEGHRGQADIAFDNLLETVTMNIPAS
jgi:hypothetical protein